MDVALESAAARGFGTALRAEHMLFRGRRAKNEHGEPSPGPAGEDEWSYDEWLREIAPGHAARHPEIPIVWG